ncbi:lipocalin family protein [Pedobacter sp. Hv1]|uniref:lipocalin family protein n=1 Tax=Pedobacter sp. Hv1 TaxID=1740090 RepID=UPI0006D8B8FE|nr:lipocalin family protein [Pedobacter sp. Hv1]KQC02514.1 hypothetical protein AQF98_02755 [Pedobacter sp. Hv1]
MKKYKLPILLLIITASIFTACKKENKETDPLLSKTWKRALQDKNTSTNPKGDVLYQAVTDCQKDDLYNFNADGTFKIDNGTEKCEVTEEKTTTGTYSVVNKEIVIKGVKYTLAEASADQLKYYIPVASGSGYTYVVFLLQ